MVGQLFALVACLAVAIADPTNHGEMGGMGMGVGSNPPAATATITVGGMDMGMAGNSMMLIGYSMGGNAEWNKVNDPGMPAGKKHDIMVGGEKNIYTPDSVIAAVGDMIHFTFQKKNHTLTQSTFDKPCVKMAGGMDSGFMANLDGNMSPPPTFQLQVLDTKAIWFYCRQKGHCGMGMGFGVNPTADKSQSAFIAAAIAQNGTAGADAGASATTGGAPPATSTSAPAAPPATTVAAAAPAGTSVVAGTGVVGANGQCGCSCFCGVASFPLAAQGVGHMGGYGGAIPGK